MRNKQEMSNIDNNSDLIDSLPTDKNNPTHSEIQIVDSLFKKQHTTFQKILLGSKDVLIVGFLFILFSLPQIDEMIRKFAPSTETSVYIFIFVKTLFFMFSYFVLMNVYLVRK